jgi:hypothetical protein
MAEHVERMGDKSSETNVVWQTKRKKEGRPWLRWLDDVDDLEETGVSRLRTKAVDRNVLHAGILQWLKYKTYIETVNTTEFFIIACFGPFKRNNFYNLIFL